MSHHLSPLYYTPVASLKDNTVFTCLRSRAGIYLPAIVHFNNLVLLQSYYRSAPLPLLPYWHHDLLLLPGMALLFYFSVFAMPAIGCLCVAFTSLCFFFGSFCFARCIISVSYFSRRSWPLKILYLYLCLCVLSYSALHFVWLYRCEYRSCCVFEDSCLFSHLAPGPHNSRTEQVASSLRPSRR